jgi:nucleotidyltransferase substrate binding protein (TIGR01987 family)
MTSAIPMPEDVRWRQRFSNYRKALGALEEGVHLAAQRSLSRLEQQGLIQGFEFTHELAWNVLKDYLQAQGFTEIIGSKNATRLAFSNGLVTDGTTWMDMIAARNLTSPTYNANVALGIVGDILNRFYPVFVEMAARFERINPQSDPAQPHPGA